MPVPSGTVAFSSTYEPAAPALAPTETIDTETFPTAVVVVIVVLVVVEVVAVPVVLTVPDVQEPPAHTLIVYSPARGAAVAP